MPVKMNREQLDFWRELLAPFPGDALSQKSVGGRDLTYIDKRSLANRLDSVVGPTGWYPEYRDAGGRGLICKLFLYVPMPDGSWGWLAKEDGGSDEEMTKKQGGQQIKDVDNSFKSELTNAFRRAAQDAWGIGRYLYQKGIPLFLDPSIPAEAICGQPPAPAKQGGQYNGHPIIDEMVAQTDREIISETHAKAHEEMSAHAKEARAAAAAPAPQVERIDIPAMGRDVYQWARVMEQRFRTGLIGGMKQGASARNLNPEQMYQWPQEAVNGICGEAIDHIKTLATYRGEFDHITPQAPAPVAPASEPPPPSAPAPPNTGDPLAAVKLELMTKIGNHIERQLGVKPNNVQLKAAFQTVAAECQTGSGHVGEVPDSLKDLADGVWIKNMIALVDENLKKPPVVQPAAVDNEIPF